METAKDRSPCTDRFVRKHKYIHCDDPRYSAGTDMENRVEPPPLEIIGDPLDRQRCICDFDQNRIDLQNCLVLGAGGIGQNVGLTLARLGVRSITFVDKDKYEASNLSRQLLGSLNDIGKRKVDVAVEGINKCHNISDVAVDGCHLDALTSWDKVVSLAQRNSVIFNGIDVGTVFDFAVNSLSKALSIPLVQGQSASWSVNAEFYTGQPGLLCGACFTGINSSFALDGASFRAISDRLTLWIGVYRDNYTTSESSSVTAGSSVENLHLSSDMIFQFLKQDKQYRVDGPTVVNIIRDAIQSVNNNAAVKVIDIAGGSTSAATFSTTLNVDNFILFRDFKLFLAEYYRLALERLLPDRICSQLDILFIPQPRGVPTRYVGSWVCPCLITAGVMVSQWVNYLTGPTGRDPPSSFQLSLASCRTDICDTALECGFVDPPSQSSDHSSSSCLTCKKTSIKIEEQLFFSLMRVPLRPIEGRVFQWDEGQVGMSDEDRRSPLNINHTTESTESRVEIRGGTLWYNIDHLGPEYSDLALDAVPCTMRTGGEGYSEILAGEKSETSRNWPVELMRPLGKGVIDILPIDMRGELDYVCAYGSGQRSALLHAPLDRTILGSSSKWYRLKGCGMPNRGFTVEVALDDNGKPIQVPSAAIYTLSDNVNGKATKDVKTLRKIRGAAYQHTCAIELEMTTVVASALNGVGMTCANISLGRWDYINPTSPPTLPSVSPSTSSHGEYPLVTRSCALFENLGDRRLNDHVLRGLELLLPLVASMAPGHTPIEEYYTSSPSPYASALKALENVRKMKIVHDDSLDVEKYDEFDSRLSRAVLLYNGGATSPVSLFADLTDRDTGLQGMKNPLSSQFPVAAPRYLKGIWDQCCEVLSSPPEGDDDPFPLGYLYWRLGRECGTVGRVLHENNIMWGTYMDATGRHMNAHGNNLALLREELRDGSELNPSGAFLAPLDFDMSYTRDSCDFGSGTREGDLKMFDDLIESEVSELGFNLSMCQSSKESTTSGTFPPCSLPLDMGIIRLALRDTLVKGWLSAVQGIDDEHPTQPALRGRAYAILKLALILTWDIIA